MNAAVDTLLVAAATLSVAATSLTAFGLRQRRYRGWRWWVAAMWLTTLGAATGAGALGGAAQALSALLLMQWPILTMVGLRRFHARRGLPGSERIDWALLAGAALLLGASLSGLLGGPAWGADGSTGPWITAACSMALHLYAAVLLFFGPSGRESVPMQGLGAAMALVAFAPGVAAMQGGEWLTPLQAQALAAALGSVVMAFAALTLVCERTERQLRDSGRRLRTLANMDALTQVPNRRYFHELASLALRHDSPGSAVLLMFDIDHFKRINDDLGHAAGDRALCVVSGSVIEHLRAHDVAGRHGGDEFVLLLRRAGTRHAMGVAARIVAEVQRRAAYERLPHVSLSFGMVQMAAAEGIDAAVRRADQALYEAKRQGRSRAVAALGNEARPVFGESQSLGLTVC